MSFYFRYFALHIQLRKFQSVVVCFLEWLPSRGETVQLFHGSVCITVLESRFRDGSVCFGKTMLSNKNKENKNTLLYLFVLLLVVRVNI